MQYRQLGQGPTVSAIGLGCMGMTGLYDKPDPLEAAATIDRAIELGCTFLDTAESYGPYINEEFIGCCIEGRRGKVTLATKFGMEFTDGAISGTNSRPELIRAVVEASLEASAGGPYRPTLSAPR